MSEFVVRPFAFMRLTHEAIRIERNALVGHAEAHATNPGAETLAAARRSMADLKRAIELHAKQEESGFFPMLDAKFDAAATEAGFFDEHTDEHGRMGILDDALADSAASTAEGAAKLLAAVQAWAEANEMLGKISLAVFADNERAVQLYRSRGFTDEGRRVGEYLEDGVLRDDLLLARSV